MEYSVITQGLTKNYGLQAVVNRIDLVVPSCAVYGFLGPNGAGKTTTLKMLLGLVHPTSGEAKVLGLPMTLKNRLAVLKDVGSLIESPSYYGHLTARENLEIVRQLKNLSKNAINEVLELVRLDPSSKKQVKHFSLGMKQRLGIATALMGKPRLLLLDEPTNGLDPAGIQEMRELIKSLPSQYGTSVVISSHLLSEIDQMADFVGIIERGHLVFQDTIEALRAKAPSYIALRTTDIDRTMSIFPSANLKDDWVFFGMLNDNEAAGISMKLAAAGVGIVRMEERHESLEQVFLQMTNSEVSL